MTVRYFEGFDFYGSLTDMVSGRWSWNNFNHNNFYNPSEIGTWVYMVPGRYDGQALHFAGYNGFPVIVLETFQPLHDSIAVMFFGAAVRFNVAAFNPNYVRFIDYASQANVNASAYAAQCTMTFNADGTISLYQGTEADTLIGQTASVITIGGDWAYVELMLNFPSGQYELRVNEVTVLAGTHTLTTTSNQSFDGFLLGHEMDFEIISVFDNSFDWDDIYVADNGGTASNTFLGNVRVQTLMPRGDTGQRDFTSTGANNYTQIREIPPDYDASYVTTQAIGGEDLYLMTLPVDVPDTVYGVQITSMARKTDAGILMFRHQMVSEANSWGGGVPSYPTEMSKTGASLQGPVKYPPATWLYFSDLYPYDPWTGAPWTSLAALALQAGFKTTQDNIP